MTDISDVLLRMSESPHYAVRRDVLRDAATRLSDAESRVRIILDAIRDPENQPSQYGTVPMEWHEAALGLLRRCLPYVGMVRSGDVPGDDEIYGLIGEIEKFIARHGQPG